MAYKPDWSGSNKNWALEGQNIFYGKEWSQKMTGKKAPAIIDTGSSIIGVPHDAYAFLKEKWNTDISGLDCITDDNFCQVMTPCSELYSKLKPIGIQMSDYVFEMKPELYLH